MVYNATLAASCAADNCPPIYKKIQQKISCMHITQFHNLSWCSILKYLSILSSKSFCQKQKYNNPHNICTHKRKPISSWCFWIAYVCTCVDLSWINFLNDIWVDPECKCICQIQAAALCWDCLFLSFRLSWRTELPHEALIYREVLLLKVLENKV